MKTRQEIKAIGKQRFSEFYWPCVGAAVIPVLISGVLSAVGNGNEKLASICSLIALLVVGNLLIGGCYFFIQRILGRTDISVSTIFSAGFAGYGRKLGGYLLTQLYTFLWSLLLIVPGIIKGYAYALTPYILSDCPNVKANDARKLSIRIMQGHKWELFVFQLSFIGWILLSAITGGILAIFYVGPYMSSSIACWYLEAREEALRNGVITLGQLEGSEAV